MHTPSSLWEHWVSTIIMAARPTDNWPGPSSLMLVTYVTHACRPMKCMQMLASFAMRDRIIYYIYNSHTARPAPYTLLLASGYGRRSSWCTASVSAPITCMFEQPQLYDQPGTPSLVSLWWWVCWRSVCTRWLETWFSRYIFHLIFIWLVRYIHLLTVVVAFEFN